MGRKGQVGNRTGQKPEGPGHRHSTRMVNLALVLALLASGTVFMAACGTAQPTDAPIVVALATTAVPPTPTEPRPADTTTPLPTYTTAPTNTPTQLPPTETPAPPTATATPV